MGCNLCLVNNTKVLAWIMTWHMCQPANTILIPIWHQAIGNHQSETTIIIVSHKPYYKSLIPIWHQTISNQFSDSICWQCPMNHITNHVTTVFNKSCLNLVTHWFLWAVNFVNILWHQPYLFCPKLSHHANGQTTKAHPTLINLAPYQ